MDQIISYNAKLDLLEKTHEIEEMERERHFKKVELQKQKYEQIRSKNTTESLRITTSNIIMKDEAIRRELIEKMMSLQDSDGSSFILGPIIDVLENFEGINILLLKYIFYSISM